MLSLGLFFAGKRYREKEEGNEEGNVFKNTRRAWFQREEHRHPMGIFQGAARRRTRAEDRETAFADK